MEQEGKYIYCIVDTGQERNFGPIGIGNRGDEVLTIGYDDLSVVASSHPMSRFAINRQSMMAHEKVLEEVMKEFDSVLPVRFGTVAADADEIRNLLHKRYKEFKSALRDMEHKVELGVKGVWKDMSSIFKEIVNENERIRKLKESVQNDTNKENMKAKIQVGMMVEEALAKKKEKEAEKIIDVLKRSAIEYKLDRTAGDQMFMNGAFLVDKGRVKEFDNMMNDLSEEHKNRIMFAYAGPLPVFNFVDIAIHPEEWEK